MVHINGYNEPLHILLQNILYEENLPCAKEADAVIKNIHGMKRAMKFLHALKYDENPPVLDSYDDGITDGTAPLTLASILFPLAEVINQESFFDHIPKPLRDRVSLQLQVLIDLSSNEKAQDPDILTRIVDHPNNPRHKTYGELLEDSATAISNFAMACSNDGKKTQVLLRGFTSMAQEYLQTGDIKIKPEELKDEMYQEMRRNLTKSYDLKVPDEKERLLSDIDAYGRSVQERMDFAVVTAFAAQQLLQISRHI